MKFKSFDSVILNTAIPEKQLRQGDVGTIVDFEKGKPYCTVEFFRNNETFAVEAIDLSFLTKKPALRKRGIKPKEITKTFRNTKVREGNKRITGGSLQK